MRRWASADSITTPLSGRTPGRADGKLPSQSVMQKPGFHCPGGPAARGPQIRQPPGVGPGQYFNSGSNRRRPLQWHGHGSGGHGPAVCTAAAVTDAYRDRHGASESVAVTRTVTVG